MSDELTVLFAIAFDHPVFVEQEALGAQRRIIVGSEGARLEFPRPRDSSDSYALAPPASAGIGFHNYLENGWGIADDRTSVIEIYAVLIAIPITATLSFPLSSNQIGGKDVQEMLQGASEWFNAFCHRLWVLSAQPLDPTNPDPKVLNRRSNSIYFAASGSNTFSLPACGSPVLTVRLDRDSAVSERIISRGVIDRAVEGAGTSIIDGSTKSFEPCRLVGNELALSLSVSFYLASAM